MTQQEIKAIAAAAEDLRAELIRVGFRPPGADALVLAAMPAIIACETGSVRYASAP